MTESTQESRPAEPSPLWWFWGLPVAAVMLTAARLVVLERSAEGTSRWLAFSPDTHFYLDMVAGAAARAPFGHRIAAPFLASLLPLEPHEALRVVTYACLGVSYATLWATLQRLRFGLWPALFSFAALFGTLRHLLLVQNPFLTDAFALMSTSVMLYFLVRGRAPGFGLAAVVGTLGREDALFCSPSFVGTGRLRAALVVVSCTLVAFVIPRVLHPELRYDWYGFGQLATFAYYAKLYLGFGVPWALAALGFFLLRSHRAELATFAAFALVGSVAQSLSARDTTRVILPLLPVCVVFWAAAYQQLRHRWVVPGWWVLLAVAPFMTLPNALAGSGVEQIAELEDWYVAHATWIVTFHCAGALLSVASASLLRRRLSEGARDTLVTIAALRAQLTAGADGPNERVARSENSPS